jgi:hypothetical protein
VLNTQHRVVFGVWRQRLPLAAEEWDLYGKPKGKPCVEIDYDARYVVKRRTVDKI